MNNLVKALGTLLTITLAVITVSAQAQAQVTEQWVARYDGPAHGYDEAHKMVVDAVGNVYVTGASRQGTTITNDYTTVKYDTNGKELWVRRYNGPENSEDVAVALAVDAGGNVYVTGYSFTTVYSSNYDYATVKYDTNGNELWVRRYQGPTTSDDRPVALALDAVGNVYVTGHSTLYQGGFTIRESDYVTVKYDTNGNEVWVRTYNGPANNRDEPTALAVDLSGNVYVTGSAVTGFGDAGQYTEDFATVKYDAHGNEVWVRRFSGFSGPGNRTSDGARALAVDVAGNVYVTGYSYPPPNSGALFLENIATIKYDISGNELWVRRYNGSATPVALAVDVTGNVYVGGTKYVNSNDSNYLTIKYDTNGNELWERSYNGPYNTYDSAVALAVDATGSVYITGSSDKVIANWYSNDAIATIKYDTDGKELWVSRYTELGNPSGGTGNSVAVDAAGNAYVTGNIYGYPSAQSGESDYLTIKYRADTQTSPTAVATVSSTLLECVNLNGETVTLSGARSSDPGGLPLTYNWTGPFGTASGVTVNVPVPLGTHVITLTVSNGSSSATATVTVTVQDTIAPYVNAGADITLEASSSAGAAYTVTPVSSDACSITSVVITPVLSIYPLGATPVMVTATDASRNSASDSLVVTVVDTTPPTLTVPANITTSATGALTPVTLGTVTATDAVDGVITVTNNAPASGFAVGTTTVIYTATDSHANSVSKSQLVTVTDTTGPTLTIPADITKEATGALTPVALGTASASDAVDGALVVNNNAPAAGFPVGMTLVLYTATDSHANSVSMSQRVTVTDTTAPTLSVPADITVTATGMLTPVNLGTASAMDLVDGVVAVTNDAPFAGFPVGMATVTYTTTDSHGNSMTKTQRVTVTDSAAPLTIGNYTLISSTRVSRTDFVYTYRAIIFNSGFTTRTPTATLSIATPGVTILDGTLSFGTVPAGTTATSTDTFSLRHDRSSAFSEADFHWQIQ